MNIQDLHKIFISEELSISIDTRTLKKGDVFFALKGDNFNGNKFTAQAFQSGASYAVVDEHEGIVNQQCILVDDVLQALQQMAARHVEFLKIKTEIIGLTGSNGKTTTKELLYSVLKKKFNVYCTQGNLNNHIGVPLTILSTPVNSDFLIVEMGANHLKEIGFLCEISKPRYGIITNIGKAHLEGFGSIEGILKTKTELFDYVLNHGKEIFINTDNKLLRQHCAEKNISGIKYGNDQSFSASALPDSSSPFLKLSIHLDGIPIDIHSNLTGIYNKENILAAATMGMYFGVSADDIKSAIEEYSPINNRSQFVKTKRNGIILDAYNANPTSMEFALNNFKLLEKENSKKVIILGEMKELGDETESEHQKITELLKTFHNYEILLVGKAFNNPSHAFTQFSSKDFLINYLNEQNYTDCLFLIKGSRSNQLEELINYL